MPVLPRKLQLGAFDQAHEGWLNTDVTPHMFVARVSGLAWLLHRVGLLTRARYEAYRAGSFRALRYLDVSRRFRFPDATFDCVFASHLLEHLHPDTAEHCVREVHRVLRIGGILRLVVPDLDRMVAGYDPADPDAFLWGVYQGRGRRAKATARHWWHYNETSLSALLEATGFHHVERTAYRRGRCPDVERIDNRPGSLFLEAVR